MVSVGIAGLLVAISTLHHLGLVDLKFLFKLFRIVYTWLIGQSHNLNVTNVQIAGDDIGYQAFPEFKD